MIDLLTLLKTSITLKSHFPNSNISSQTAYLTKTENDSRTESFLVVNSAETYNLVISPFAPVDDSKYFYKHTLFLPYQEFGDLLLK